MTAPRATDWAALPLAMTVEEAAAALGVSRNLAYQMVAEKRIPSVTLGRRIVIPRQALERLLEAGAGISPASEARP